MVTHTNNFNSVPQSQPQPDYSNLTDKEELYARLANGGLRPSVYDVDNNGFTPESVDYVENDDIAQLHGRIQPTDVELLYARLPEDILPVVDNDEPLTEDQQELHARIIGDELENQGYPVDGNENGD